MSRTYRNPKYMRERSLVTHLNYNYNRRFYNSIKEEIYYNKLKRDGCGGHTETDRNSGFTHASARYIRVRNKELCHKILIDDDYYDHRSYTTQKETKYMIWDFW